MATIRVDVDYTIFDGSEVVFRSPVDCSTITGLKVCYVGSDGITTSKLFAFADAHGNNVGDIDHLFAENVVVKVILDVTTGMAFVQNADTNAYLESKFEALETGKAASSHNHSASNITSGTLSSDRLPTVPFEKGGLGSTNRLDAARNLTGESVTSPNAVVGLTDNHNKFGWTSLQQLRNAAGLGNTTGALPIANGGTGATTRLAAAKNLTNEAVSSPNYFVSLTNDWGKFGYTSIAQAKTSLGLTPAMAFGTEYATNERWNNGKTVYAKACSLGTMPSAAGDKVYASLISGYTQVIGFDVFLHNPSANSVIFQNHNIYFTNTHKGLVYECPGDRSQYKGYAVIRYVK